MHVSMPARPHLVSMKKGFLGDSTCVGIFLGVRGEGGVPVQAPAEGDALQRLHVRVAVHAHPLRGRSRCRCCPCPPRPARRCNCVCSPSAVAPLRPPSQRALALLGTQGRTAGANGAPGCAVQRTPLVTASQWRSALPAQGMLPADIASRQPPNGLAAATRGLTHACGGPPWQGVGHLAKTRRASLTRATPAHTQLEDV